ncbi:MAG: recombinase family protein [Clostridia bacterium]|nr:recombinase family protein [Clostridia bacterium]
MIAIYARQSIEKKDSVSIEAQIEKCKSFCNNKEYRIYKDAGYSGKNINRPQFTKLLEDIKSGLVNKVIAYRLDRISRSIADFSQLLIMFEEYNVKFVSATENFDTDTPMGRAMINIVMTFAQLERETIVERVTDNYYFRANNGYWAGGHAPYGYKIKHVVGTDGKRHSILEIDKDQSIIVKRIYDMYINNNISMRKISQQLNLEKVPTLKGNGLWGINAVRSIISRPIYTQATSKIYDYYNNLGANITNNIENYDGTMTANLYGKAKKNVKVKALRDYSDMYLSLIKCPPLISNEDWFKAQKIKGIKKNMPPRSNSSKISFLCGLVKCGKCGSNMVTQGCVNNLGVKYYYLICTAKRNLGVNVCNNQMVSVQKLQEIVLNDIKEHFNSKNITKKIDKYLNNTEKQNTELLKRKEVLENDIIKLDVQISNLLNSIADGNASSLKYINQKIEQLDKDKTEKTNELSSLSINSISNDNSYIIDFIKNINEKLLSEDFEELKLLCKTVIEKIIINDKNIDIHYKI